MVNKPKKIDWDTIELNAGLTVAAILIILMIVRAIVEHI